MIPFKSNAPTTVLGYRDGKFVGQFYEKLFSITDAAEKAKKHEWIGGKGPQKIVIIQNNNYKLEYELCNR